MKHLLITLLAFLLSLSACNKDDNEIIVDPEVDTPMTDTLVVDTAIDTLVTDTIISNPNGQIDYRLEYIGIYDCTKSSQSFDDDMFTTDLEVLVEIDSTMDSLIIVNGIKIPLELEGNFGLEAYSGNYYDLSFADGMIRLSINEIFPNGLAIPCFIKGKKRALDYRLPYVGIYDCTKSNTSFDDDMFTTDLEVVVEIDPTMDSLIIVNDIKIPLELNGIFGLEEFEGSYYDLIFCEGMIRLSINEIFPFGIAIPCYIKGKKR